ncbi:MAG: CCA tRNA nucleotidyltransferase [Oscillochloridaceae bacterium]|nr:CCA tRNA nucleotidyltransferase [Oscillochloridaceae bacterium]
MAAAVKNMHAPPEALLARLPLDLRAILARAASLAEAQQARLWLVGGVVRDLLCQAPPGRDVDLAVEGDALALAHELAAQTGGRLRAAHAAFGTASVEVLANGATLILDLASSRVERYPSPGALPEVAPAPIEDDLYRRDFSVNALAIELRAEDGQVRAGRLLDPCGGRADLVTGRLRLLHEHSLRDDPTRMLRGVRLAARLGLRPDPATAAQIQEALRAGYLRLVSNERILAELCLCLEEPRPDETVRLADAWEVTPQVIPGLAWSEALSARCARLADAPGDALAGGPLVWAGLLLYDLDAEGLTAIAARYPLPVEAAELLRQLPVLRATAPLLTPDLPNSGLDRLLRPFSVAAITALHYAEPAAAAMTARYLRELRTMRPPLNGNDLQRLGITPGPLLGRTLEALRAAALDGEISTREEAEDWVRRRGQGTLGA